MYTVLYKFTRFLGIALCMQFSTVYEAFMLVSWYLICLSQEFNSLGVTQIKKLNYLIIHKQDLEKNTIVPHFLWNHIDSGKGKERIY